MLRHLCDVYNSSLARAPISELRKKMGSCRAAHLSPRRSPLRLHVYPSLGINVVLSVRRLSFLTLDERVEKKCMDSCRAAP
jgi:hypothetical protein